MTSIASLAFIVLASLSEATTLYDAGDFGSATVMVNEMILNEGALAPENMALVFLLKARLELAFDRPLELRLWLTKARALGLPLTLDPLKDPPQLVSLWTEIGTMVRHSAIKSPPPLPAREAKPTGRSGM